MRGRLEPHLRMPFALDLWLSGPIEETCKIRVLCSQRLEFFIGITGEGHDILAGESPLDFLCQYMECCRLAKGFAAGKCYTVQQRVFFDCR